MSDLATPLLVLFEDDALAFWCFAALMRTFGARANFAVDESGIFAQLRGLSGVLARADKVLAHKLTAMGAGDCHFAYRMVVVLMRRDLPLAQVREHGEAGGRGWFVWVRRTGSAAGGGMRASERSSLDTPTSSYPSSAATPLSNESPNPS